MKAFLERAKQQFDIVFLDPPFHKNLIEPCISWLKQNNCLTSNAYIYTETEKNLATSIIDNWELLRQKTTGQVTYSLLRRCTTVAAR